MSASDENSENGEILQPAAPALSPRRTTIASLRLSLPFKILRVLYLTTLTAWSSTVYFLIVRKAFTHEGYMHAVKTLIFVDFSKFYTAGLLAWSPERTKLYDFPTQMLWCQNILGQLDHPPDSIPYTPMFCVLMRVFTWLPIEKAMLLALATTFAAAAIAVTKILVDQGQLKKTEIMMFWILAMTPLGVLEVFQLGQSSFFWLATMAAFYGCFLKKKDILAGVAIALLALKPQYAILASSAFFGGLRWRVLIAAAVTELLLVLIATGVIGIDTMLYYPKFLNFAGGHVTSFIPNHNPSLGMITLRGLLAPFLPEEFNFHLCSMISFALWIPLFFVWRKCSKVGTEALSWATVLTVACTLFFSAHSMIYDFVIIIIGWAVTLKSGELSGYSTSEDELKRLWVWLFWLIPGFTWLFAGHVSYEVSARTHAIILLTVIGFALTRLYGLFKSAPEANQSAL